MLQGVSQAACSLSGSMHGQDETWRSWASRRAGGRHCTHAIINLYATEHTAASPCMAPTPTTRLPATMHAGLEQGSTRSSSTMPGPNTSKPHSQEGASLHLNHVNLWCAAPHTRQQAVLGSIKAGRVGAGCKRRQRQAR